MSINMVSITGNLTRDGELRMTSGGFQVLALGMAVNDRRKNPQTGEWEDYANFIDCVMFGQRAQNVAPYMVKGTKVAIDGSLRWSQWERNGEKRSKLEVVVSNIDFMSRQGSQNAAGGAQYQQHGGYTMQPRNAPQAQPQQPQGHVYGLGQPNQHPSMYDSDIPF